MPKRPIDKACEKVGGQTALAKKLGLRSQGSVSRWIATGLVPPRRVLAVEAASGVSRHELRPDLYPRDPATPRQQQLAQH
ncbi:MAG: transcriptional regulator [Terriglobales bacterium]